MSSVKVLIVVLVMDETEPAIFWYLFFCTENESVLIGIPVAIAIILSLLLMGLGIICCKKHNKGTVGTP